MDDETKERIVRAVLLFCAIVIAAVSAYTTFMLFHTYEIDINFSPPDDVAQFNPSEDEERRGTASFDLEKEKDGETFKSEEIKPAEGVGVINPLVIFEDMDGDDRVILFVLMALEIFIVFFVYLKVDKKVKKT